MFKKYVQQYNLTCVEASMGQALRCTNLSSVYSIDSTSLRFNDKDPKAEVLVLLLADS